MLAAGNKVRLEDKNPRVVLAKLRKPVASWEKLGTVEEVVEDEWDDAKSRDAAEDADRKEHGEEFRSGGGRPGQNRQHLRGARARWSGRSMSCRTSLSAVGASIALLDGD